MEANDTIRQRRLKHDLLLRSEVDDLNKQSGFGPGTSGQDGREAHDFINAISHGLCIHTHIFQAGAAGDELEITNLLCFLEHI
jgi:hypothetical protein